MVRLDYSLTGLWLDLKDHFNQQKAKFIYAVKLQY